VRSLKLETYFLRFGYWLETDSIIGEQMNISLIKQLASRNLTMAAIFTLSLNFSLAHAITDVWVANGDDTVTDLATGLVWQQQDDGSARNHAQAITYCQELVLANKSDWRLPDVKELATLVDFRSSSPSIDIAAFPNTNSIEFWSVTNSTNGASRAWLVSFADGSTRDDNKININLVRCVR